MHSVNLKVYSDKEIYIDGEEFNINDLKSITLNTGDGETFITGCEFKVKTKEQKKVEYNLFFIHKCLLCGEVDTMEIKKIDGNNLKRKINMAIDDEFEADYRFCLKTNCNGLRYLIGYKLEKIEEKIIVCENCPRDDFEITHNNFSCKLDNVLCDMNDLRKKLVKSHYGEDYNFRKSIII